jgi:hypothetical protein
MRVVESADQAHVPPDEEGGKRRSSLQSKVLADIVVPPLFVAAVKEIATEVPSLANDDDSSMGVGGACVLERILNEEPEGNETAPYSAAEGPETVTCTINAPDDLAPTKATVVGLTLVAAAAEVDENEIVGGKKYLPDIATFDALEFLKTEKLSVTAASLDVEGGASNHT